MQKQKWYFRSESLIVAFLLAGPLMLPLVWYNGGFSQKKKTIITVLVVAASTTMFIIFLKSFILVLNQYKNIFA